MLSSLWQISWQCLKLRKEFLKMRKVLPYDPILPVQSTHPSEMKTDVYTKTSVFTAGFWWFIFV